MTDDLLNLTEAGTVTGLGRDSIRRRINAGKLAAVRDGRGTRVSRAALRSAGLLDESAPVGEISPGDDELAERELDDDGLDEVDDLEGDQVPGRGGFLGALIEGLRA